MEVEGVSASEEDDVSESAKEVSASERVVVSASEREAVENDRRQTSDDAPSSYGVYPCTLLFTREGVT